MPRRVLPFIQSLLVFLPLVLAANPSPDRVIIIQADDLGYGDVGWHGNRLVSTPALDRLATESVELQDFTVNPVCAASRATLMTGRHFLKTGVSHVHGGKDFLNLDEVTLGDLFQRAGWRTGYWGKWHLGVEPGYEAWHRGFDVAKRLQLYRHRNAVFFTEGEEDGDVERSLTGQWGDAWMVDEAIAFLKQQMGEKAFLYLASMTPHSPLDAPDRFIQPYLDAGLSMNLAKHFGMISHLDFQIGRLLEFLKTEGLADSTVILFTSDNGPSISRHLFTDADRQLRKPDRMRGWKGDVWEGGVRAPCLIRWLGNLEPGVVLKPIDQADILPTLAELCQLPIEGNTLPLDGVSQVEALNLLDKSQKVARPIFNWSHPGWITGLRPYDPRGIAGEYNPLTASTKSQMDPAAESMSVRLGRYKLVRNQDQPDTAGNRPLKTGLFDLWADPGETTDLATTLPEKRQAMDALLDDWFTEILNQPSSFGHPRLRVEGEGPRDIAAKLVKGVSPSLQNAVNGLYGWNQEGQWAEYDLQVANAGPFWVKFQGSNLGELRGEFIVNGKARASHATGWISPTPVWLDAGSQTLRLELQGLQVEAGEVPEIQLETLSLSREDPRPRVFIFTDINIDMGDPDDRQSLIHLLWYANELRIEGIVPDRMGEPQGLEACLMAVDAYAADFEALNWASLGYPEPDRVRSLIAPSQDEVVDRFREAASRDDSPLYVLVWGAMRNFGRALRAHPELVPNIRVLTIGTGLMMERHIQHIPDSWEALPPCEMMNWNAGGRNAIFEDPRFNDMWWVELNWTYEGMFTGSEPKQMWNQLNTFGTLGGHMREVTRNQEWARYFRVGDTPTVLYVIDPRPRLDDPGQPSWAGRFVQPFLSERPHYWTDFSGSLEWSYADPCSTWDLHELVEDEARGTLEHERPGMYASLLAKLQAIYSR